MEKWDWENIASFSSKPTDSPKKLPEWMTVDGGDINPYNSGHSSVSASTDSSTRDFRFISFEGNSPSLEASSGEPLIGLKLGKRTYFENNTNFTVIPTPSSTALKKNKSTCQNESTGCQVEGCEVDLSRAKDYHRKHRVCSSHSKSPKVIVGGMECRFCQQCSRFHGLSDFDEKKRSCRRRLSDHNARRRKPQPETIQFNSARRLSSAYYEGIQRVGFPPVHNSPTPANSTWDRVSNHKFTLTNGDASTDGGGHLHSSRMKFPHPTNHQYGAKGPFASKNHSFDVFNPGSRGSLAFPPSPVTAPDRALSLLSSNSWDSCEPEHVPLHNLMHETDSNIAHAIPEGVPLSSAEFWLNGQQSMHPNIQSLTTSSNFQEFQIFKSPYEADFYSGILN